MEVFDVSAKISIDSSEFEKGLNNAGEQANVFAEVLNANLVTKGIAVAVDALKKLGEAAFDVFKQSISAYADYEQLSGGIESLYKDSANTIMQYAENAFQTTGMSANEYLQATTAFSASLIASTGRTTQTNLKELEDSLDEEYKQTKRYLEDQYEIAKKYYDDQIELVDSNDKVKKAKLKEQRDADLKEIKRSHEDQLEALKKHNADALEEAEKLNNFTETTSESLAKAAELNDMALQDIADNVNRFGVYTTQELTGVYQALSKGMYTTLDNLNLGFAGTKEGMQKLIDKANQLRGSNDLTIDSFADIVVAIHEVQKEMGITGTTADEADKTITGSVNKVKAAWKNLVAGIADENANMDKLINDFVKAADVALDNLIPVAERALEGLMELGIKMLPEAVELGVRIAKAIAKDVIKALRTPLSMLVKAIGGIFGLDAYGMKLDDQINQAGAYAEMAARASGGWINSGKTYLVGEKGPELITADRTMYVHNADETAKMLGGGRDIVINIAGDVYDDQYSMRKKIKGAVMSVLQEQMAYG